MFLFVSALHALQRHGSLPTSLFKTLALCKRVPTYIHLSLINSHVPLAPPTHTLDFLADFAPPLSLFFAGKSAQNNLPGKPPAKSFKSCTVATIPRYIFEDWTGQILRIGTPIRSYKTSGV